ncbi:sperm-associated antigen 7-like [Drosophila obscura]|uniref:sperm-associated antigen 7-like n=1 Tax=Drosophila obscura TaxID=7282 RepID=UPI001BB18C6E|nr:sperm-associated antigen 7-like [Drosophila obscura]
MDQRDSILNPTAAPLPTPEQIEQMRKKLDAKEELRNFRKSVRNQINEFAKDDRAYIELEAVDNVHRMAIYDIAAEAGLVSLFLERQSLVYKREHYPSEDEIKARQNGEVWNEEKAKECAEKRKRAQLAEKPCKRMAIPAEAGCATNIENTGGKVKPVSACNARQGDLIGTTRAPKTALEQQKQRTALQKERQPQQQQKQQKQEQQ